ncbi:MAG: DUF2085 domain-containing protein [Salinibacter sp.]
MRRRSVIGRLRTRFVWIILLAGTSSIFLLALLPPFLPAGIQDVVRRCFAPVCHQLPGRSFHIGSVPIAICDRCSGIYLGLVLGVAITGWRRSVWTALGRHGRYLLLGSLVPLGLDWIAPFLGLWKNGPLSRALTGLLFGSVAAGYVTDRVLRKVARTTSPEDSKHS